jgi:hypothetical protein
MANLLIYQTSDPDFAERAIDALREAGMECHRSGQGARRLSSTTGNWTDKQIFIYIHREEAYQRANEVLIGLGAAVDKPLKTPNRWLLLILAAVLAVIALLVAKA